MLRRINISIAIFAILIAMGDHTFAAGSFGQCDSSDRADLTPEIVLSRLNERRELFVSEGEIVDIFPAMYFETTKVMLEEIESMSKEDSQPIREQIILFYEAYESNRRAFASKTSIESHWKAYYREARRLEKKKKKNEEVTAYEIIGLLLDGVDAHLIDLSRSVRFQISERSVSAESLNAAYFQLDKVFPAAMKLFHADITESFTERMISVPPLTLLEFGETYIIHARHEAWETAIGSGKLRTKKPQPHLCKDVAGVFKK